MPYRSGLKANTKPAREKQGALIVAIYLPTKHSLPRRNAGFFIGYRQEAKLKLVISLGSICPVTPPFD